MTHHNTEPEHGDITQAMRAFGLALAGFAQWPWSSFRQRQLVTAFNTVLELHISRILSLVNQATAGPIERIRAQLGRHERRIAEQDRRIAALESAGKSRELGGGGGDGAL